MPFTTYQLNFGQFMSDITLSNKKKRFLINPGNFFGIFFETEFLNWNKLVDDTNNNITKSKKFVIEVIININKIK